MQLRLASNFHHAAKDGDTLPPPPKLWNCRHAPPRQDAWGSHGVLSTISTEILTGVILFWCPRARGGTSALQSYQAGRCRGTQLLDQQRRGRGELKMSCLASVGVTCSQLTAKTVQMEPYSPYLQVKSFKVIRVLNSTKIELNQDFFLNF